jgi:hypothetical protein
MMMKQKKTVYGTTVNQLEPSDLEQYESGTGLRWRGDSRSPMFMCTPPGLIFEQGFHRQDASYAAYYAREQAIEKAGEQWRPKLHLGEPATRRNLVSGLYDVLQSSAVCVSPKREAAGVFPLKEKDDDAAKLQWTWIYAVRIENGFNTFVWQKDKGQGDVKVLKLAKEQCCRDIPALHVLGAIRCERRYTNPAGSWQEGTFIKFVGEFVENHRSIGCPDREALLKQARSDIKYVELAFIGRRDGDGFFKVYP